MSLLLDARKKSQQARSTLGGDNSLPELESTQGTQQNAHPPGSARSAGQNLFNAKYTASSLTLSGINRNVLIALAGAILLLSVGATYVWFVTVGSSQPLRPINAPAVNPLPVLQPTPQNNVAIESVAPPVVSQSHSVKAAPVRTARTASSSPQAPTNKTMRIDRQIEPIDPILNSAYLAYRSGKFEQARQQYQEVLKLDARNIDALLGMAVIAQHRGSDNEAAHYYTQALLLDPRNAVANAGMSVLTTDDNRESRLKYLLNEQQNSSSLHFALGNYYTEQTRWSDAQKSYANAYTLEPDNTEIAFNLAVSLDRLGQKKSAAQYYQRALQLDKANVEKSPSLNHTQIELRIQELVR